MGKAIVSDGKLFRKIVPNINVFTPDVIGYYRNGPYEIELSRGWDTDGSHQFGVTVVDIYKKEHDHDRSKLFHSRKGAVNYMNTGILR